VLIFLRVRGAQADATNHRTAFSCGQPAAALVDRVVCGRDGQLMRAIEAAPLDGRQVRTGIEAVDQADQHPRVARKARIDKRPRGRASCTQRRPEVVNGLTGRCFHAGADDRDRFARRWRRRGHTPAGLAITAPSTGRPFRGSN
jgi:hypothetical protein